MSRSKTHQGVEMRSTLGMKVSKKSQTWLILMNRSQAKIFNLENRSTDLIEVKSWEFPKGKMRGSDLVSDQPGRVFNSMTISKGGHQSGAPRHSYSNKIDPQTHVAEISVKKVIDWIEKNKAKEKISNLVCVAEPRLMGILQKQLKKRGANSLQKKWEKDFGWLEENEVRERLITWLTGRKSPKKRLIPRPIGAFGIPKKERIYSL